MANLDDVARFASTLPSVDEGESRGNQAWSVRGKMFAWERPFTKADIRRFGDTEAPGGEILGLSVDDLSEKEAVLQAGLPGFFTIPHFDGYAAVLVQLEVVDDEALREAIVDAWLSKAPPALAEEFVRHEPEA